MFVTYSTGVPLGHCQCSHSWMASGYVAVCVDKNHMALPQAIDIRISMLRLAPQCFAFTSSNMFRDRMIESPVRHFVLAPPHKLFRVGVSYPSPLPPAIL